MTNEGQRNTSLIIALVAIAVLALIAYAIWQANQTGPLDTVTPTPFEEDRDQVSPIPTVSPTPLPTGTTTSTPVTTTTPTATL